MRLWHRRALVVAALGAAIALAYRQALTGQVLFARDAMRFFIPDSAFLLECLRRGELALWTPYIRLGQPFLATLQSQVLYPPRILTVLLFGPVAGYTVQHLLHVALAAAGTYLAARRLVTSRVAALTGAIVFALSPMLTDLAGQRNVADAAAWSGFIALAALGVRRSPSVHSVAWLALAFTASFLGGSPETVLWQGLVALALVGMRRGVLGVGAAAVWALGVGAAVLLPALEFLKRSSRGGAGDVLEWSTSWAQVLGLFWPFAEQPRGSYWGGADQWFVLTVFLGTVTVALAGVAVTRRRMRLLAATGALVLLLATGRHFPPTALLFSLPPLEWFRYPAKYLAGVAFVVALLAAAGLNRLAARARAREGSPRAAILAVVATGSLFVAGTFVVKLEPFRPGARGGWVWLMGMALVGLALYFGTPSVRRRGRVVLAGLALLAIGELGLFHALQLGGGWTTVEALDHPSRFASAIARPFEGRVSVGDLGAGDPLTETGSESHEVTRDALLGNRFVEERLRAIEGGWVPELRGVDEFHLSGSRAVYDLAGVEYYARTGGPPFPDLEAVAEVPGVRTLWRSITAMPRAFIVHRAEFVDAAVALQKVTDATQPARHTAYLTGEGFGVLQTAECDESIAGVEEESANRVVVLTDACGAGFLVLSDTWYPGWHATLDGQKVPLHRADYLLRAVQVPGGRHRVVFEYRPVSFSAGVALSVVCLLALGAVLLRDRISPPRR